MNWIPKTDEEAELYWREKNEQAIANHEAEKRKRLGAETLRDDAAHRQHCAMKSYFDRVSHKHGI